MEIEFLVTGKLKVYVKTIFDIKTEQDIYNELRNKGFYDLSVCELKEK